MGNGPGRWTTPGQRAAEERGRVLVTTDTAATSTPVRHAHALEQVGQILGAHVARGDGGERQPPSPPKADSNEVTPAR